jgi:DNA processing protein
MTLSPDVEAWLRICLINGLGDASIRRLLVAFGSPAEILASTTHALERIVKKPIAHKIKQGPDQDKLATTLAWLEDPTNSIVTLADTDYPSLLLNISDPPPLLYFKGQRKLLGTPKLAIVGSRNATPSGISTAEAFAVAASNAGFCVVSGMALGIDAAAHQGGLRGASASIAVVGTGLDIVYPSRNHKLAHELSKKGALISEFPLGTPAIGRNFPRRNRIISGMTQGCLIVEAALRSGSLITARQALEQGREVLAIPGSIHSPLAKGCHELIKQGAKLVENIQDVLDELSYHSTNDTVTSHEIKNVDAVENTENTLLLKHIDHNMTDIDTLCVRSGLTADAVSAMLLTLELDGIIASLPGGYYQRI